MLIKFPELIERHNIHPVGVLHIGASTGQELDMYYQNGIKRSIWIEALPDVYKQLLQNCCNYPDAIALNACIGAHDGSPVMFNVSSNDGESSSYLEFGVHAELHPDVKWVDVIPMKTIRVDTLLEEKGLTLEGTDFLNVDVQGVELEALKSMGHLLHGIKYAYIECNKLETYRECSLLSEVEEYMAKFDFVKVDEKWVGDCWGDVMFVKR